MNSMRVKLSVVIITFNEEKNIGRCIDSVKPVADDIVVVDSYSNDLTCDIAREKGARVVQHPFGGHIQQKNHAITQALYPHILSLDADEALSEKLCEEIGKARLYWNADGFTMNRLNFYCGRWIRHCGWYPDVKLRLWDSRKGSWGGENPHDRYIMQQGAVIRHLKGDILHYSYFDSDQHLKQIRKFAEISAKAKYEKGQNIGIPLTWIRMAHVFIKKYLLQVGFLDGYQGFKISLRSAWGIYLKDSILRKLNHK